MAERRPAGFNVILKFYDSPEVESIPRRIRAAAIGVWTLCGSYSANKMTDGYVSAEKLKQFGCTPAIRAALKATRDGEGKPSPLWIDASDGGIQFANWAKYQRTYAEVKAYRDSESERKRGARKAKRDAATSANEKMSGRTPTGQPQEYGYLSTKNREEIPTHLSQSATDPNARDSIAATAGADLVRKIIPPEHPTAVQTMLRLRANELIHSGQPADVVEDALRLWLTKPLGPNALASLVSDVIKTRGARAAPVNGLTAGEAKVAGWMNLGHQPDDPDEPKAIRA